VRLPELCPADRRQDVIGIVVPHIEGQVPVDAFERAGAIETACPAGPNGMLDRLLRHVFDEIPGAAAGELRLVVAPRFPKVCHVPQPEVPGLHVDRHVADVLLHIRIIPLVLGRQVLQGKQEPSQVTLGSDRSQASSIRLSGNAVRYSRAGWPTPPP
jgi:hypothetical protein